MRDLPGKLTGERLEVDKYFGDYEARFSALAGGDSWKLERRQSFQEQGSPSWDAFARGEWGEALRLLEQRRESLVDDYASAARAGWTLYRVRIVAEPISPYMRWELHSLRQRNECGEKIRIVEAANIVELERGGELPEILTLGSDAVYQILYDEDGVLRGAFRSLLASEVAAWRNFIDDLYGHGEDIENYFDRKAALLRPPRVQ
jgi:hypothetical protein